ncbi:ribosome-inactivating protein charybdin-like [Asparagus officinalis]|uniref:ribosome-inactivating protein charybdin-like n=1 Tax=Asparagus officinalis TaxID=4686 RepID=UPI00098DF89C|nr:ribosome-inactivating protein charybdin-like [Asparagus officinalis]
MTKFVLDELEVPLTRAGLQIPVRATKFGIVQSHFHFFSILEKYNPETSLLAGFLMLWLKRCVVPTRLVDALAVEVIYPAVLLAHGKPVSLLHAMTELIFRCFMNRSNLGDETLCVFQSFNQSFSGGFRQLQELIKGDPGRIPAKVTQFGDKVVLDTDALDKVSNTEEGLKIAGEGTEKMQANAITSIEINLSYDLTAANYVSKIEKMRQDLAETWTRNRPVLPTVLDEKDPDFEKKLTWYDIVLVFNNGKSRVRLRIRRDQLYFQGFRVNDAGKWFELGIEGTDKHLIDKESTLLGFGHNYTALLRAAGFDATGGLTEVTLGREKLISAAQWLENPPTVKKRAEALLIVIVMFCESTRFVPISSYLRRTWQQSLKAPEWLEKLVHRWGELSGCVLFYDANPTQKWVPQELVVEGPAPDFKPVKVVARTVDELLGYLGILQRDPSTIVPPKP